MIMTGSVSITSSGTFINLAEVTHISTRLPLALTGEPPAVPLLGGGSQSALTGEPVVP